MRLKTRTWVIISLLSFIGAAYFWRLGDEKAARDRKNAPQKAGPSNVTTKASQTSSSNPLLISKVWQSNAATPGISTNGPFPYRLSNTTRRLNDLVRSDNAILLRNAWIDVSQGTALPIPAHLRAQGDPGSYIVQSRGIITDEFRRQLREAGASVISYIPNNGYLVQVSPAGAQRIAAFAGTQTVLPWEPYYKLSPGLLKLAVEHQNPPDATLLNVLLLPGAQATARADFEKLNVDVLGEDRSPFGQQLVVKIPSQAFLPLTQLPSVHAIEPYLRRAPANDLTRARVRVATNTTTGVNYRGLTGNGVQVNVNDTGIDGGHPDLTGRVTAFDAATLSDFDGHGTHVSGIIASSGANGPSGSNVRGSTN